jgi:hypothetical protein
MPNEFTMLQSQIDKLANARTHHQRAALERSVLLWSGRVYHWTQDTSAMLTKQIAWLDKNTESPTYENRFTEWEKSLREYERACDLLDTAKAALPGIDLKAAA